MAKKKFVPMTGLDNLNQEEKLSYYHDACEHFGVPAELNLLEFIWMDSGDNRDRHLVLYAKKGATDILRETRGIHIDEMKETTGDGVIMFTAKGHDKNGRTDIAVGAASLKSLTGKSLVDAIMTAQTRASRRLTLQFVGGGLLDESEVHPGSATVQSESTSALKNVAAAPTVAPNATPGKDITAPVVEPKVIEPPTQPGPVAATAVSTPVQAPAEEAPKRRRRRRSEVVLNPDHDNQGLRPNPLDSPLPVGVFSPEPPFVLGPTPAQLAAQEALKSVPAESAEDKEIREAEERVAALRARKNAVQAPPLPALAAVCSRPPMPGESITNLKEPTPPPVAKDFPKEEQMKEFKQKLFLYTNDILRKGNMKGSEGIGGVEYKMRAFVRVMFPQALETKSLNVDQWKTLFGYLDSKLEELGAEGLVKLINEKIGAKES